MDRQEVAGGNMAICTQTAVSPALAAAQEKLESLRRAHCQDQSERPTNVGESTEVKVGRSKNPEFLKNNQARPKFLPKHLGWNSGPASIAYRRALRNQSGQTVTRKPPISSDLEPLPPPQPEFPTASESLLNLPPDIALAILRNKLAAPARIWLLFRHLDQKGQGWISAGVARKRLTRKQSNLVVCGGRQLRNLLAAGDNVFWQRDGDRIWLKSMAKVAAALGLSRLYGRPVKLPVSVLLESIGTVRAHFYATFHSGRSGVQDSGTGSQGKPISRKTLKTLSARTRRTQKLYEKITGIRPKSNYAIGHGHSIKAEQNLAWQHGRAIFRFTDHKGLIGKSGRTYLARQLPNSYDGIHDILPKGYHRRINRQLTDLLNKGITGNGENKAYDGPERSFRKRVFHRDGAKAAETYNRRSHQDLYWKSRVKASRFDLWHTLPALERRNNHLWKRRK